MKKVLLIFILNLPAILLHSQEGIITFRFNSSPELLEPILEYGFDYDGFYKDPGLQDMYTRAEAMDAIGIDIHTTTVGSFLKKDHIKEKKTIEYKGSILFNLKNQNGYFQSIGLAYPIIQESGKTKKQAMFYINIYEILHYIENDTLDGFDKKYLKILIEDFKKGLLSKLEPTAITTLEVENWNCINYQSLTYLDRHLLQYRNYFGVTYLEDSLKTMVNYDNKLSERQKLIGKSFDADFISLKRKIEIYKLPADSSLEHRYMYINNEKTSYKVNYLYVRFVPKAICLKFKKNQANEAFSMWVDYDVYQRIFTNNTYLSKYIYDSYFNTQFIKDVDMHLYLGKNFFHEKIYERSR